MHRTPKTCLSPHRRPVGVDHPFAGHDPAQGGGDLGATGEHRPVGCGHRDHDATPTVGMIQGVGHCWIATSTPISRVSDAVHEGASEHQALMTLEVGDMLELGCLSYVRIA